MSCDSTNASQIAYELCLDVTVCKPQLLLCCCLAFAMWC